MVLFGVLARAVDIGCVIVYSLGICMYTLCPWRNGIEVVRADVPQVTDSSGTLLSRRPLFRRQAVRGDTMFGRMLHSERRHNSDGERQRVQKAG